VPSGFAGAEPPSGMFWNNSGLPFSSTPERVSPGPGTLSKIGTDPTTWPASNETPPLPDVYANSP
jgi:hypothetical protein